MYILVLLFSTWHGATAAELSTKYDSREYCELAAHQAERNFSDGSGRTVIDHVCVTIDEQQLDAGE